MQIAVSTISDPACQEQVVEAAKLVAKSIEAVMQVGQVRQIQSYIAPPAILPGLYCLGYTAWAILPGLYCLGYNTWAIKPGL